MITEEEVVWTYRVIFGREPESAEVIRRHTSQQDLASFKHACLISPEFRSLWPSIFTATSPQNLYPLDRAPPIHVESSVSASDEAAMWAVIARSWESLGQSDLYWSVLTEDRFRLDRMSNAEALDEFYLTGQNELTRMDAWLARANVQPDIGGVCAEYGCGAGRVTEHLARRFGKVLAFDISAVHLEAAQLRLKNLGLHNVEFVLVREPNDLRVLTACDVFFSVIVLQHNPPPIIRCILRQAMAGLRPTGIAYFQVPTYRTGYVFDAAQYLRARQGQTEMEMHCLPQRDVLEVLIRENCVPLEIQPDGCVGAPESWLSHTFLARKEN